MTEVYHAHQLPLLKSDASHTKVCRTCGIPKIIEEFGKEKNSPDGRRATCKQCKAAQVRESKLHPKVKPVPRPGYRFCTKCGIEKLLEEFNAHKHGFAGRDPHCKVCKGAEGRATKHTPEHRERDRIKHRENKEYYAANYVKTKEAYQERGRAWRKANPEKGRDANHRRKAHKLKTVVEPVDYKAILERDGYTCYLCGNPIDPTAKPRSSASLTFDHKIPLQPRKDEPQGTHTADNIHPAHFACNVRKGNTPFELLTPWHRRGV